MRGSSRPAKRAIAVLSCLCAGLLVLALTSVPAGAHRRHHRANRTIVPGVSEYGCPMFPADNALNEEVAGLPSEPEVTAVHASDRPRRAPAPRLRQQPRLWHPLHRRRARTAEGADQVHRLRRESDPGPYPVPSNAPSRAQAHGRRQARAGRCRKAAACCTSSTTPSAAEGAAGSPARVPSSTCAQTRCAPNGWTSADAAGLPIFPLLVRYPEVAARADRSCAARNRRRGPRRASSTPPRTSPPRARTRPTPDGPAPAPEGELQPRRLLRRVADHPPRAQALRADRRRQRLLLVHHRRAQPALERRQTSNRSSGFRAPPSKPCETGPILHR